MMSQSNVFNTPMEIGMRMVYLLLELYPRKYDVFYLTYLDYAISYSGDLHGPSSLHTPVSKRGGAFLNNSDIVRKSLNKMSQFDFVEISTTDDGIYYSAGENARAVVSSIKTEYSFLLQERCNWVASFVKDKSYEDIRRLFETEGRFWGYENTIIVGS
ncbi:ABC-three component system middle component 2 [Vibrio diabolicus]|uniref:ABC-three component system middle component 2 n=1 Tax=Vibrio diabolicus TaxID=50719 RepID=UPI003753A1D5